MHKSSVRVLPSVLIVGGWRGELTIHGDILTIQSPEGDKNLVIDVKNIKRTSFNSMNGLWAFRLKEGGKVIFQSAGGLLSADRTPAGKAANEQIRALLAKHSVRGFNT